MQGSAAREILDGLSRLAAGERRRLLDSTIGDEPDLLLTLEEVLAGRPADLPDELLSAVPWDSLSQALAAVPEEPAGSVVGSRIGRILVEARLGAGGMGEVYRGHDARLDRRVAIKALRRDRRLRPRAKARLKREARTLARLEHPGICGIYDLLETEEADFLILELVEGATLCRAAAAATHDEKLALAVQIADALGAAHAAGAVHRDLKPDNVMVTAEGRAKILDFGIARWNPAEPPPGGEPAGSGNAGASSPPESASSLSLETGRGAILGTVTYMSPEQARGERVGPASDVYSLGVTLHELFCGRPPYDLDFETKTELRERIASAEVALAPDLDPLLGRVIADQLQGDPRLRPAAEQVAERLRGVRSAPARRRRRRWVAAGIAAALALVVGAGLAIAHTRLQARRQAEVARQFAEEVSELSWRMRAERLAPAHDLRPVVGRARERIDRLRRRMAELGPHAEGPGRAALGRALLEIGELDAAREQFEAAWSAGYRTGDVGFGLGQVLGEQFLARLEDATLRGSRAARDEAMEAAGAELQDRALAALAVARAEGSTLGPYVEGLIALCEERFEDARARAAEALAAAAWLFEAKLLEGRAYRAEAIRVGYQSPTPDRAVPLFEAATESYRSAAELAPSSREALQGLCRAEREELTFLSTGRLRRSVPQTALDRMQERCEAALQLDPGDVRQLIEIVVMLAMRGYAAGREGNDPEPLFERAIEVATLAIDSAPDTELAWTRRGFTRTLRGITRTWRGGDAKAAYDAGLLDLRRAQSLDRNHGNVSLLALALQFRGALAIDRGEDPRPWLEECVETTAAENAVSGVVDLVWHREAECNLLLGGWEAEREGGLARLERAVAVARRIAEEMGSREVLSESLVALAGALAARGLEAAPPVDEVVRLTEAGGEAPQGPDLWLVRGRALLLRAKIATGSGTADVERTLEAALAALRHAGEKGSFAIALLWQLADAYLLGAEIVLERGLPQEPWLDAAGEALDECDRLQPGLQRTAELRTVRADLAARHSGHAA